MVKGIFLLFKGYWSFLNPQAYRSLRGTLKDPFKGTPIDPFKGVSEFSYFFGGGCRPRARKSPPPPARGRPVAFGRGLGIRGTRGIRD